MKRFLIALFLAALPLILINVFTLAGHGPWTTSGIEVLLLPILLGLVVAILALLVAVSRRCRAKALATVAVSAGLFSGGVAGFAVGSELRMLAFKSAAGRAAPLVAAVRAYEEKNGAPPSRLELLVPEYLAEMPSRLPPLGIIVGDAASQGYLGNTWALVAKVSSGFVNWDMFIYLPDQNRCASR